MRTPTSTSATAARKKPPRFAIAILAAGKGTRLKSNRPKVLHEIAGKPLLAHVVAAASKVVPPENIFAIIGHEAELVREALAGAGINFVLQPEQRGTGHAIMVAQDALQGFEHVLVLSGDVPLIRPETIERVRDFHRSKRRGHDDPHRRARRSYRLWPGVSQDRRRKRTRTRSSASWSRSHCAARKPSEREINSGIYAFATKPLFAHIEKLTHRQLAARVLPDRHGRPAG